MGMFRGSVKVSLKMCCPRFACETGPQEPRSRHEVGERVRAWGLMVSFALDAASFHGQRGLHPMTAPRRSCRDPARCAHGARGHIASSYRWTLTVATLAGLGFISGKTRRFVSLKPRRTLLLTASLCRRLLGVA